MAPPAGAVDLTDGARGHLAPCAQGSGGPTAILNCSYVYLSKVAAPPYTYLSSQGAVSWKGGTFTGGPELPAAGQTWPGLTDLFLGASGTVSPKAITGTADANGKVDLTMDYDILLKAGANGAA